MVCCCDQRPLGKQLTSIYYINKGVLKKSHNDCREGLEILTLIKEDKDILSTYRKKYRFG